MIRVFTKRTRTENGGYRQREPRYEYLDRSARPEADAIRRRITRWLRSYPQSHQQEWVARFASGDDGAYSSAFFELYLYTYLRKSGFSVEVAPGSNRGTVKAPDFKARRGRLAFYLEATTAHDQSADERRIESWKSSVRSYIDAIPNDWFFVSLRWLQPPTVHPAPAKTARTVERWLLTLDYDELHARYELPEFPFPNLRMDIAGGRLEVLAWPKNRRRQTQGLLGGESFGLRQVNVLPAVRGALRAKSSRYGEMDLPYVVAINVHAETAEDDDFIEAVYGTPEVVVRADGSHSWRYGPDGGFGRHQYPRARNVSAVLCVRDISPWTIGQEHERRLMYVIHHPQCRISLPRDEIGLGERWVEGGRVQASRDRLARTVLGIRRDWPDVR